MPVLHNEHTVDITDHKKGFVKSVEMQSNGNDVLALPD